MMRESVASAQIEGSTVQKGAAIAMLRRNYVPNDLSERMVRNVFDAMRFAESASDREMSPELIDEVHGFVLQGLMDTGDMSFRIDDSVAVRESLRTWFIISRFRLNTFLNPSRSVDQVSEGAKRVCFGAEGTRTDLFGHVPTMKNLN